MQLALLVSILISFSEGQAFAGWNDTPPVSINSSPGIIDVHYNSGNRRIVRIGDTVIALCPESGSQDHTYRSTNGGAAWTEIDTDGTYSGCLITGKDNYVYHFYNSGTTIHMIKFLYNGNPPAPVAIQTVEPSSADIRYRSVGATVDSTGKLYVAYHGGSPYDYIYVTTSTDGGTTWAGPYTVATPSSKPLYYPRLDVTTDNTVVMVYQELSPAATADDCFFAKSIDGGVNWTSTTLSTTNIINPDILTVGADSLYVFAQSKVTSNIGCVFRKSTNGGTTWSDWTLIEGTIAATGYADPSSALGSDGTIYVSYRNDSRTSSGAWREHMARSTDGGATWEVVYDYDEAPERTGTRSHLRYQTWYNYGGPLEWTWMQYVNSGANHPIYYCKNEAVSIKSTSAETENTAPVARAGSDQTVSQNSTVTVNGGASYDADGDTLSYAWSFSSRPSGSTATLSGSTSPQASFRADVNGTYVLKLVVNDGTVNSLPDSVSIFTQDSQAPSAPTGVSATIISD